MPAPLLVVRKPTSLHFTPPGYIIPHSHPAHGGSTIRLLLTEAPPAILGSFSPCSCLSGLSPRTWFNPSMSVECTCFYLLLPGNTCLTLIAPLLTPVPIPAKPRQARKAPLLRRKPSLFSAR